jgi:hypothetical protein
VSVSNHPDARRNAALDPKANGRVRALVLQDLQTDALILVPQERDELMGGVTLRLPAELR